MNKPGTIFNIQDMEAYAEKARLSERRRIKRIIKKMAIEQVNRGNGYIVEADLLIQELER